MGLNIKNERVHELAREAAALTGQTQTGVIEEALVRFLAAHGSDPSAARVQAKIDLVHDIVLRYAGAQSSAQGKVQRVEDLYDDATGLPR